MTQQEIDMLEDEEGARWQVRIEQTIRDAGLSPCDASGCDSGDPLDWSDTQIRRALIDARDAALEEAASLCENASGAGELLAEEIRSLKEN